MEDSHAIDLNLDGESDDTQSNTFFAVYDGHGGTWQLSSALIKNFMSPFQDLRSRSTLVKTYTSGCSKRRPTGRNNITKH